MENGMMKMQTLFSGPELCRLQAHEVIALLKSGDISPQDCLDAAFARIADVEPAINAMPTLCGTLPGRGITCFAGRRPGGVACRSSSCDQGPEHGCRSENHFRNEGILRLCS